MGRLESKFPQGISILMTLFYTVFAIEVSGNNIPDNTNIKIETSKIRNIIKHSNNSTAKVNVGSIKQSHIAGRSQISVQANKIDNQISAGSNNKLTTNIGVIQNSNIDGKLNINVKTQGDIVNRIHSGSGNRSEVSVGTIVGEANDTYAKIPDSYNDSGIQQAISSLIRSDSNKSLNQAILQPASLTIPSTPSSDKNAYTIEKRQSSIRDLGGHNFLVLRDPNGKVLFEFHGLPVDLRTGKVANKGISPYHGLRFIEFDHSKGEKSGKIKIDQPSVVLFRGNKQHIISLWKRGRQKGKEINRLKIPYPKLGIKLFGHPINSNSVESTLSMAMGLKSPKLKLPLKIQDLEEAIEYDKKPEQNFLYTPGEGRLIRP